MPKVACSLCNTIVDARTLVNPNNLEPVLVEMIKRERPEWRPNAACATHAASKYRAKKFLGFTWRTSTQDFGDGKSRCDADRARGRVTSWCTRNSK